MSSSRHPIALRLERRVGGATKLLATVMLLPLIDGIFAALVLAGALDTVAGIVQVGLLVFGGSATLAVILAEMDGTRREQATTVLAVGIPLILLAAIEAAAAPTFETLLDTGVFHRFAAIVILAIAAKTASATIGEYLPSAGTIVAFGLIASLHLSDVALVVQYEPELIMRAAAAGGVGVAFSLSVVAFGPYLRTIVDIDRFRFGSAVALGTLAFSVAGLVPQGAALPVFVIAGLLAVNPEAADASDESVTSASTTTRTESNVPSADGGSAPDDTPVEEAAYGYPGEGSKQNDERAPWL